MVDVVVVNWNSGELLRRCISSLDRSSAAVRCIVVDNASTDGSADSLETASIDLKLVCNPTNLGFGVACNQGAKLGESRHLLFLNPDVEVAPDTLASACALLDAPGNERIGVVGVRLIDEGGITQRSCARAPTIRRLLTQAVALDHIAPRAFESHLMLEWDHSETRAVDQVMGAFLLIRRDVFEELGGFDERFFVYYEDVDLCESVRRAGWAVVHHAGAQAYHKGQGTTLRVKDKRLFYLLRSQILYARKHFGKTFAACLALALLGVHLPLRAARAAVGGSIADLHATARASVMLLRVLPSLILGGSASRNGRAARII